MSERRRVMVVGLGSVFTVVLAVAGVLLHVMPTRPHTVRPGSVAVAHAAPAIAPRISASPHVTWTTVTADGGGPGAEVADLSELTPVQEFNVSKVAAGPVRIGTVTYTDSVRFTCDSGGHDSAGDLDYVVTGYGSMSAVIGVPSDDAHAASDTMAVSFFNNGNGSQASGPVTVSLGHPQVVHLRFSGSSQLEISCSAVGGAGQSAQYMDLALGNATIGPS